MNKLPTKWEVVEENLPYFRGRTYKDRPKNVVELLERTVTDLLKVKALSPGKDA